LQAIAGSAWILLELILLGALLLYSMVRKLIKKGFEMVKY